MSVLCGPSSTVITVPKLHIENQAERNKIFLPPNDKYNISSFDSSNEDCPIEELEIKYVKENKADVEKVRIITSLTSKKISIQLPEHNKTLSQKHSFRVVATARGGRSS